MNLFQKYGIKEVADVVFYSITTVGDEEIYTPVLFLDTLKVSTIEKAAEKVTAEGGKGNKKLITWNFGKEITLNLEDALFTPASMSLIWGGQLESRLSPYTSAITKLTIANKYGNLNYSTKAYPSPALTDEEWEIVFRAATESDLTAGSIGLKEVIDKVEDSEDGDYLMIPYVIAGVSIDGDTINMPIAWLIAKKTNNYMPDILRASETIGGEDSDDSGYYEGYVIFQDNDQPTYISKVNFLIANKKCYVVNSNPTITVGTDLSDNTYVAIDLNDVNADPIVITTYVQYQTLVAAGHYSFYKRASATKDKYCYQLLTHPNTDEFSGSPIGSPAGYATGGLSLYLSSTLGNVDNNKLNQIYLQKYTAATAESDTDDSISIFWIDENIPNNDESIKMLVYNSQTGKYVPTTYKAHYTNEESVASTDSKSIILNKLKAFQPTGEIYWTPTYTQTLDEETIEENRTNLRKSYFYRKFEGDSYELTPAMPQIVIDYIVHYIDELKKIGTIETSIYDTEIIDRMEKCIVTNRNGLRISTKQQRQNLLKYYSGDESSSYIIYYDAKTMLPLLNIAEDGRIQGWDAIEENNEIVTPPHDRNFDGISDDDTFVLKLGTVYYKWSRTVKYKVGTDDGILGKTFVIDAETFPEAYKIVGETYIREQKTGKDQRYQFIIHRASVSSDTSITLEAEGDPTTFSMSVDVLTPPNDIMMELKQFDVDEDKLHGGTRIVPQKSRYTYTAVNIDQKDTFGIDNPEMY